MAVEVLEKLGELRAEEERLVAMHFGAMRVMDSTRGGGWGSFRVDGLDAEQADELPGYIEQFVGERLPHLYYDDEGQLQQCGGSLVTENHTKFTRTNTWLNEQTGEHQTRFKWNKELWDPETAEAVAAQKAASERRKRLTKYATRAFFGVLFAVEAVGFGMMIKGLNDGGELRRDHAPEAEIREADELAQDGVKVILGVGLVGGIGMTAALSVTVMNEIKADKEKSKKAS